MVFKDYYKILGLETNKINNEEIKNAYRLMAKKYHPDINIKEEFAEERFKDINEAYQVLTNTTAKRKYDRIWVSNRLRKTNSSRNRRNKNSDSLFSEFFSVFFGESDVKPTFKNKKVASKGDDIETEITVSLEDAFFGVDKKISLRAIDGKMKNLIVKVPEGIRNGEKIRLTQQGKQGKNGGKNGDLFIKIKIQKHEKYTLEGSDIYLDLKLTPWEAALGKRISIPCLDGETIVYVPPKISSGEKIRLPKKGYKSGFGDRGDLIAEIKITIPKELSEEEIKLYEQLQQISNFNPREE